MWDDMRLLYTNVVYFSVVKFSWLKYSNTVGI